MKISCFGDSFTSGENNNFKSYVDYLPIKVKKIGESGTCMGDYSIYPVFDRCLLDALKKNLRQVKKSDVIFLEYGINDTASIISGNTTFNQVVLSLFKAIDYIYQINPHCRIIFLKLTSDEKMLAQYGFNYERYLKKDYLKESSIFISDWKDMYEKIFDIIDKKVYVIDMIDDSDFQHIDDDNIHPNDKGYQIIANNIWGKLCSLGITKKN